MAINTETRVTLVDDIDGGTDGSVATREFRFHVLTELSDANYAKLATEIGSLLAKARPAQPATTARATAKASRKNASPQQSARNKRIREWAKTEGMTVSDRGRPGKTVETAYAAATGDVG